jgi:hypothetical protein
MLINGSSRLMSGIPVIVAGTCLPPFAMIWELLTAK